jgi:hypothetical protein
VELYVEKIETGLGWSKFEAGGDEKLKRIFLSGLESPAHQVTKPTQMTDINEYLLFYMWSCMLYHWHHFAFTDQRHKP